MSTLEDKGRVEEESEEEEEEDDDCDYDRPTEEELAEFLRGVIRDPPENATYETLQQIYSRNGRHRLELYEVTTCSSCRKVFWKDDFPVLECPQRLCWKRYCASCLAFCECCSCVACVCHRKYKACCYTAPKCELKQKGHVKDS